MRLLFAKKSLAWPRTSGHDVHTFYMMKACAELGHHVGFASLIEPDKDALGGLPLVGKFSLAAKSVPRSDAPPLTALQRKFRSYWGIPDQHIEALRAAAHEMTADVVVVSGLDALPYFPALSGVKRVWYAADEWVLHHLSQIGPSSRTNIEDLRAAAIKGLYERAHRSVVDRVWVVSDRDKRAMQWVAGMRHVDVLPNGVDGTFFAPGSETVRPATAVFWGRLDFGPNIQALEWFFKRVWPQVRQRRADASFTIIGAQPTDPVRRMTAEQGVTLLADVPDLRAAARSHAIAVLPFVSGVGIKNKLLEAAALGMPIVCTRRAASGLCGTPPIVATDKAESFADSMIDLWAKDERRRRLGSEAREWVLRHHTWLTVARTALNNLEAHPLPSSPRTE